MHGIWLGGGACLPGLWLRPYRRAVERWVALGRDTRLLRNPFRVDTAGGHEAQRNPIYRERREVGMPRVALVLKCKPTASRLAAERTASSSRVVPPGR